MEDIAKKLTDWQKAALKRADFGFVAKLLKKFPLAEIYLVGGATRDIILGRETKDFDFVVAKVDAEDLEKFLAKEGEVNLVGKSFGVFKFNPCLTAPHARGGATRPQIGSGGWESDAIDIALPRTEHAGMSGGYRDFDVQSDKDLPIESDLARRDFTINALAWDIKNKKLIDEFDSLKDLEHKIIRAIGDPRERFQEDYTRMMRAVRFACQLDFEIEAKTLKTIGDKAEKILIIPRERTGEEFVKIIESKNAEAGVRLMQKIGLLKALMPELEAGVGVGQNRMHIYEVFEHNVRALGVAAQNNFKFEIRLAALCHDIAKPQTKAGNGPNSTFYDHDQLGAKMTRALLKRLKFSNDQIKSITHLVRYHMFYYALDTVTDAGVRRLLNRLGKENIDDFINLRICDRLGMGRPKAKPWKLIELERRLKEVQLDPINPKMLKLDGTELMAILKIKPGPRIGLILNALLGEMLDSPEKNEKEYLTRRVKELNELKDDELKAMHPDIKFYEEERKRLLHGQK